MLKPDGDGKTTYPDLSFDNELVVFQVENTFFRVFRRQFTYHSPVFRDMFSMPQEREALVDGNQTDHPIVLEGDEIKDFVALLSYFYRDFADFSSSRAEWMSIMKLAHKYQMEKLLEVAKKELSTHKFQDPFEKLALCEQYDIPLSWAADAIKDICWRVNNVAIYEGRQLSRDWMVAVLFVRQEVLRRRLEQAESPSRRRVGTIATDHTEELEKAIHAKEPSISNNKKEAPGSHGESPAY